MIERLRAAADAVRAGADDVPDLDAVLAELGTTPVDALRADAPALHEAVRDLTAAVAARLDRLAADLERVGRRRAAAGFACLEPRRRHRRETTA